MIYNKGDKVLFTDELLKATLDPNGNTPFRESDVGKIFTVNCSYEYRGEEIVHLQHGFMVSRTIPLRLITQTHHSTPLTAI